MIYGFCRISTPKQSMERQERNILKAYPDAFIIREIYTGTKIWGRREFEKLLRKVRNGDTIVFDSVSRMSRTAEDGFLLYKDLFQKEVSLVFLKEPHINTETYRQSLERQIQICIESGDEAMDELMHSVIESLNRYILTLAERQIRLAFEQSEKEVEDLHQRTREGIETARLNGKQIGQTKGTKLITKKSVEAKKLIRKYSCDFEGNLNNEECRKIIGISRGAFYKYKKELLEENQE